MRRKKALDDNLSQFKIVVQSYGIEFAHSGDKLSLARVAFMLQMIGDFEEQVVELKKLIT